MANDTLDPDSEQSELSGDATVVDGATAPDGTTDTTADSTDSAAKGGKEKALADTEAALKARQAEYTKLSQAMAEMRGQMDLLAKMQAMGKQPQEEQKDVLDSISDDDLIENPAKVKEMLRGIRQEMAKVLQERDEYWRNEIGRIAGGRVDPAVAEAMNELRQDPELAGLPDSALKAMATRLAKAGGKKLAVRTPTGNIAPSRGQPAQGGNGELTAEQKMFLAISGVDRGGKRTDTLD